ncbi:unnamed protein product [Urochloa humidicola]
MPRVGHSPPASHHEPPPRPYLLPSPGLASILPLSFFFLGWTEPEQDQAPLDHLPLAGQILPISPTKSISPAPRYPPPNQLHPRPLLVANRGLHGRGLKIPRPPSSPPLHDPPPGNSHIRERLAGGNYELVAESEREQLEASTVLTEADQDLAQGRKGPRP